jgi:serine/threonine protein kinase
LVRKSGVIESERLDEYLRQNSPLPTDPRAAADQLVAEGLLTRFQRDQLLRGKWRGFTLGKYRVLERLGRGGMGTVFLAEHVVMRRLVAIKVLPEGRAEEPAAVSRFHREARAAAVLDHPNVIRAHDVDCEGKVHFLVMEYVDGVSLQALVEGGGPLDVVRACHYVYQTAAGLHSLHQAGLIHRDVKPGNILVDRQGTVKLLDLGLARFYHDQQDRLTREIGDEAIMGTADYLSPEQGRNSHEVDARADVYSLGATLYFLLAGQAPFEGRTVTHKLLGHQLEEPPPLPARVPEGLAAVVTRMMAKMPADRYQSAAAAAAALTPWVIGPVPPLSEDELPRLSLAARTGRLPSPFAGPRTFPSVPGRETDGPSAGSGPPSDSVPSSGSIVPSAPPSNAPTQTAPALFPVPGRRRWRTALITGIVLVAVVVGVGLRWATSRNPVDPSPSPTPPPVQPGPPPGPPPLVERLVATTGQKERHATLAAALAKAGPGDRVLVHPEILEERLALRGVAFPEPGVTVEAAAVSGKPITWLAPADQPSGQALLDLSDVAGLRLKGFRLDGRHRLDDLISLSGLCPGVSLEEVHLQGFRRSAVQFKDCAGEPNRPVVLVKAQVFGGADLAFGLVFRGGLTSANREVQVRDSRIEGPLQAGVQLAGPVASAQFQGNRFFQMTDAFQVHKIELKQPLLLNVASNTFAKIDVAIHFLHQLPSNQVRLTVANNLFVDTKKMAHVDDYLPQPANVPARWIWYDENRTVVVEPRYFRTSFQIPAAATVTRATLDVTADHAFTAWVNGQRAGQGELNPNTKRVYGLDVTRFLHKGKNVIAIQAINRFKPDGTPAVGGGLLAQLTYVTKAGDARTVAPTLGRTWRASKQGPEGWQNADFDDSAWPATRPFGNYGQGPGLWHNLIWDSAIEEHFPGVARPVLVTPKGNVRNRSGAEEFPLLDTRVRDFTLPMEPADDLHFLRYPASQRQLSEAGPGKSPVGAPPVE